MAIQEKIHPFHQVEGERKLECSFCGKKAQFSEWVVWSFSAPTFNEEGGFSADCPFCKRTSRFKY